MLIDPRVLQEVKPRQDVTGFPKYYAMFGGATGTSDPLLREVSIVAPTPDANYMHRVYYDMIPQESGN